MYLSPEKTTLLPEPSPAKVDEIIRDRIRVRWQATNWDAYIYVRNLSEFPVDISPGQPVTVIGRKGIRLIVLI